MSKLRVGDWAWLNPKGVYMDLLPNTLVEVVIDDKTDLAPLGFRPLLVGTKCVTYWAAREGDLTKIELQEAPDAPAKPQKVKVPHTESGVPKP